MGGEPGAAAIAAPAGDVPGDDDEIARLDVGHALAGVDDLGDALVADRERRRDRREAGDDHLVDVAGRRGHRADDCVEAGLEDGVGLLPPLESPLRHEGQLTHRAIR